MRLSFRDCFRRYNHQLVVGRIFAGLVRVCITIHKVMKKLFRNLNLSLAQRALYRNIANIENGDGKTTAYRGKGTVYDIRIAPGDT